MHEGNLTELQKIDMVRERTDLSVTEARALLEDNNWDVIEALVKAESAKKGSESMVQKILERVKSLVAEGNVSRLRVKSGEDTVVEIPMTFGVLGVVLAPKLAVLGAVACMLTKCTLEIERRGPQGIEVSEEEIR